MKDFSPIPGKTHRDKDCAIMVYDEFLHLALLIIQGEQDAPAGVSHSPAWVGSVMPLFLFESGEDFPES
jgi:hypothetical protein